LPGVFLMCNAVVDTGPLIHLHEIEHLEILTAVFGKLHLPENVKLEISNEPILQFIHQHSDKIAIHQIGEPELFAAKNAYSDFRLHLADLAVITLLNKILDACAVSDDLALRRAIESSNRTVVGTIGVLFRGFKKGVINKPQLKQFIHLILNDSSLYLSSAFRSRILTIVEELQQTT